MKKGTAVAAFIVGIVLSLACILATIVTYGNVVYVPILLLGLVLIFAGHRFAHPVLLSRWSRATVTGLRLLVAIPILLSFFIFLYGYVQFTLTQHIPVGGAVEWVIFFAIALPLLLWPELRWLWQKFGIGGRTA
jgi:hypothetical protein